MALFGAPVAHEDDPERAVRAALAIRDWVVEQAGDLQLRIAVNTGEALVALGARPAKARAWPRGRGQHHRAAAGGGAGKRHPGGETTYRATAQVITYRTAEPVAAKGKAEPVPAWEALEARSRFGVDLARVAASPLVGRQRELNVLKRCPGAGARDRATAAGDPGRGAGDGQEPAGGGALSGSSTRMPSELIAWRQGRSLPYGDGVTFWALAEMVKAQAGILETDTPEQAEEKLAHRYAAHGSIQPMPNGSRAICVPSPV